MIKRIRANLTVKISLVTSVLLMLICFLTYAFIAYFMPKNYSNQLRDGMEQKVQEFVTELGSVNFDDSGQAMVRFMMQNDVTIYVYTLDGIVADMPQEAWEYIWQNGDETESRNETWPDSESEVNTDSYEESELSTEAASELNTDSEMDTYGSTESEFDTEPQTGAMGENQEMRRTDYVVEQQVYFADSKAEPYILSLSGNAREINMAVEVLDKLLPWLILLIAIVAVVSGVIYAFYVTRPILGISRNAKKMADLDFTVKCSEKRSDEIGQLAGSLNDMSGRLGRTLGELQEANTQLQSDIEKERKLERQRLEFFAAASHELKTPITILKGQLEGMIRQIGIYRDRDKYLSRCYDTVGKLEELTAEILAISRAESTELQIKKQRVDLNELLAECLELQRPLYKEKEMSVQVMAAEKMVLRADGNQLKKAIGNIIGNAVQYSPEKSEIRIEVGKEQKRVYFSVENTGVHVPEEAIPQMFKAFYRLEKSRNRNTGGSGLGLYLAKKIFMAHDGDCMMENTPEGVKVTVFFGLRENSI